MTTVSVAQFLATESVLDALGSFVVKDTAANLSAALVALSADSHVASIVDSDSAVLTLSVSQEILASRALGVLTTPTGARAGLKVVDTAANLSHDFSALFGNLSVKSIAISDNRVLTLPSTLFYEALSPGLYGRVLSIGNAGGGAVRLTPLPTMTIAALLAAEARHSSVAATVYDTAANVVANLAHLANDPAVTTIYLTDVAVLSLTAVQVQADLKALGEIVNARLTVNVADTAANLSADLNALQAVPGVPGVASVTITDSAPLTLNGAQFANDARVIGELTNKNGSPYVIGLTDTAANLSAIAASLGGNTHIGAIQVTDGKPVVVSGATWTAAGEQGALAKITGAHAVQVAWGGAKPQDTELFAYDGQGRLLTDAVFNLAGGPQTVSVAQGGEALTAGSGSRPTTWLLGGSAESFVLHAGFGKDVVTGYAPGSDSFSLDHGEVASFAALLGHASNDGHGDVIIKLGATDSLTLTGLTLAQLQAHASDWHFI